METLSQKIANEVDLLIRKRIEEVISDKFPYLESENKDLQQLLEKGKNSAYAAVIRNLTLDYIDKRRNSK